MSKTIKPENLEKELQEYLTQYKEDIDEEVVETTNTVIKEAKQGKEQAEAKGERDLLGIAIVSAMQKDTYGKLTKENLDTELDKEPGSGKYESEQLGDEIQVTFIDSGRSYLVDSKGDIVSQ